MQLHAWIPPSWIWFMTRIPLEASVQKDFQLEMKFIADIVSLFRVGPKQSRVGLVTFQTWPTTRFNMARYASKSAVQKASAAVPHQTGGTYVGKALWQVVKDMKFRASPEVHKIVVVFTDGQSFDKGTN